MRPCKLELNLKVLQSIFPYFNGRNIHLFCGRRRRGSWLSRNDRLPQLCE